jgi:hypothetical protein
VFINLKYSGTRLIGTLVDGRPSRGKTAACTAAVKKKSEVKAPKVEVAKDFIVENRKLYLGTDVAGEVRRRC